MYLGFRRNRNAKWFAIESQNNIFGPGDVYTDPTDLNAYLVKADGEHVVLDDSDLMRLGIGEVGMHEGDD